MSILSTNGLGPRETRAIVANSSQCRHVASLFQHLVIESTPSCVWPPSLFTDAHGISTKWYGWQYRNGDYKWTRWQDLVTKATFRRVITWSCARRLPSHNLHRHNHHHKTHDQQMHGYALSESRHRYPLSWSQLHQVRLCHTVLVHLVDKNCAHVVN